MKTQLFTSHNSILRSEFHSQHRHPSYFRSIGQRKHKTKFSPISFSKFSINRSSFFSKRKKKKKEKFQLFQFYLNACSFLLFKLQKKKKKRNHTKYSPLSSIYKFSSNSKQSQAHWSNTVNSRNDCLNKKATSIIRKETNFDRPAWLKWRWAVA